MKRFSNIYGYFARACGWTSVPSEDSCFATRSLKSRRYHAAVAEALEPRLLMAAPVVSSISRADSATTNLNDVLYVVVFDQAVTGVSPSTFNLSTSGITGASIGASSISGSTNTYTVDVSSGAGNGTLALSAVPDTAVKNASNQSLAAGLAGPTYTLQRSTIYSGASGAESDINSTTPTFAGKVVGGANTTVTMNIYAGAATTGTPVVTLTATPSANGTYSATVPTGSALGGGDYTVVANETSGNTTLTQSVTPFDVAVDAPGTPANLVAIPLSSTEIGLSWQAPSSSSGGVVKGYGVFISRDGGSSWDLAGKTSQTYYTVTGLIPLSQYFFTVVAYNKAGDSDPIYPPVEGWTPDGLKAVTNFQYTTLSDGPDQTQYFNFTWTAPPENAAQNATYFLEENVDWGTKNWQVVTNGDTNAEYWLPVDTKAQFRVLTLANGTQAISVPITVTTADWSQEAVFDSPDVTPPDPVEGDGANSLTWDPSANAPGYPIILTRNPDALWPLWQGAYPFWNFPKSTDAVVFDDSTNANNLEVSIPEGLTSLSALTVTPTKNTNGTNTLSWDPIDVGDDEDADVSYTVINLDVYQAYGYAPTTTSDTSITVGSGHFVVYAEEDVGGESLFSPTSKIVDVATPTPPGNLTARAISDTSVGISWGDYAYNETGFKVYRRTKGVGGVYSAWQLLDTTIADITYYTDKGLKADLTYQYQVTAVRSDAAYPLESDPCSAVEVRMPAVSFCPPCLLSAILDSMLPDTTAQADASDGVSTTGTDSTSGPSMGTGASNSLSESTVMTNAAGSGNGASSGEIPTLDELYNGDYVMSMGAYHLYFNSSYFGYSSQAGNPFTMSLNATTGDLEIRDLAGNVLTFDAPSAPEQTGKFKSFTNTDGSTIAATYPSSSTKVISQTLSNGTTQYYNYTYNTDGQPLTVTLTNGSTGGTAQQTLSYTYYTADGDNGNAGDIETITQTDVTGQSTVYYYRYYANPTNTGADLVKFIVSGDAYDRLAAATGGAVDSAADDTVAQFANNFYQYDSAGRVIQDVSAGTGCSTCAGGFGTARFGYYVSQNADNYNSWKFRRTELLPGYDATDSTNPLNVEVITYSNFLGQTLLQITKQVSTGQETMDYYRYDSNDRQILHATPGAVGGFDESLADLVGYGTSGDLLNPNTGRVEYTEYDSQGNVTATAISQGDGGTGTPTKYYLTLNTYSTHTVNGSSVEYLSASTVFSANTTTASTSAAGARTTNYTDTWRQIGGADSNVMQSATISAPAASTGQNGSGSATVSRAFYDQYGRPIWTMDGNGDISHASYDPATGAVVESITDINYGSLTTSEQASLTATGWTVHSTGLNLITTSKIDSQGRAIETIDPNGNGIFTVYDDADHATFTFTVDPTTRAAVESLLAGSGNGSLTTTGPIQVSRTDIPYTYSSGNTTLTGSYQEYLTLSGNLTVVGGVIQVPGFVASSGGTFHNLLNLSGGTFTLQSLSRTLDNSAGQTVESDSYSAISNAAYAATTVNSPYTTGTGASYAAARYGYDQQGRQKFVISASGTINWTVYDDMGRVASTWIGTNDASFTNVDPSGGAVGLAAGNNMIKVSENQYDADGNLTESIAYPDASSAHEMITLNNYNWRDELVSTKSGASANGTSAETDGVNRPITINIYDNAGEVTSTYTFNGDGISMADTNGDGIPDALASHLITPGNGTATGLVAFSTASYDNQGRIFESTIYSVANGSISSSGLVNDTWYDANSNVIESHSSGGTFTKTTYDGAGRPTLTYTTDGGSVNANGTANMTWAAANSITGDIVLTQTQAIYDANGNVIETIHRDRNSDGGSLSGALGSEKLTIPAAQSPTGANLTLTWVANVSSVGQNYGPGYVSASGLNIDTGTATGVAVWILPPATAEAALGLSGTKWAVCVGDSNWDDYIDGEYSSVTENANGTLQFTADTGAFVTSGSVGSWLNIGNFLTSANGLAPARVSYSATYYDAANRDVADVNVGTNEGVAWTRPGSVPSASNATLVTRTTYNAAGEVDTVSDANQSINNSNVSNTPQYTKYFYDAQGRVLYQVSAWDGSYDPTAGALPPASTVNADRTTAYTYDGDGHTLNMTAVMPSGQSNQTTIYNYGITTGQGSTVNSNDTLSSVIYATTLFTATGSSDAVTIKRTTSAGSTVEISDGTHTMDVPLSALTSITIATGGANDTITLDQSNGTISLPDGLIILGTGNDTLIVAGGNTTFGVDEGVYAPNLTIEAGSNATLTFTTTQHLAGLTLDAGSSAVLTSGGLKLLVLRNLSIAGGASPTAKLDLNDNALILNSNVSSSGLSAIRSDLIGGLGSNGTWNGAAGITSAAAYAADATTPQEYSLGYYQTTGAGTFLGQAYISGAVLVRYTVTGDADLNGVVNGSDVGILSSNYGGSGTNWFQGDFNYDGVTGAADLGLVAGNYGGGNSTVSYATQVMQFPDEATFTYNALGQTLTKTDQNGTTHTYTYDSLGRQTLDSVTKLAAGVDGSVRSIATTYNAQGLVDTLTSYSTTTPNASDIVNQTKNLYNGLGQLIQQYQSPHGAVITSGSNATLSVHYAYSALSSGALLTSMTYPSGQVISYSYGANGTLNQAIGRLESLSETVSGTTTTLETYQYLGLSTIVVRAQPQADDELTYQDTGSSYSSGGTTGGDEYTGLDAFGRVVDQKWDHVKVTDSNTSYTAIDEYKYTYDANGNVVAKVNPLHTAFNETYTYDDLDQLANMTRGGVAYQSWDLDALGNMDSVTTSGTTVDETHANNNELTSLGNATLAFDNNGNTLTDDQGHQLVYDAWNRLVTIKDASNVTLESYSYDAQGHRATEQPSGSLEKDLYYSSQWQVIEEDSSNSGLLLHADYVWSPVFVDALVLRDDHLSGTYDGMAFNYGDRLYATQDANYNVTALVAYTPQNADTDDNGQVDLSDLNTVLNNLGTTTTGGAADGDVNSDGHVDLNDLNTVLNELGTTEGVAERFVYDAYGNSQTYTKTWTSSTDAYAWQYKYQGGRYDTATGLSDFRNREYSPTMMRWTTQDPMGYVDGLSDYRFVNDNPINHLDPTGLVTWKNEDTAWITQGALNVANNPPPDGFQWGGIGPNTLAVTIPRLTVSYNTFWFLDNKWRCGTITVKFHSDVYVLANYPDPGEAAWVRRAENDHVTDFLNWANNVGKPLADQLEKAEKQNTFSNADDALKGIHDDIFNALKASLLSANNASIAANDTSGRHTWRGANQRP